MDPATERVKWRAFGGLAFLVAVMMLAIFVPAGTLRYVQGWSFLSVFAGCAFATTLYLLKRDPALLERRVVAGPVGERSGSQKLIQSLASLAFLSVIVVPALDVRLGGGARLPMLVSIAGDILVGLGFLIVLRVFRENSFASAVIEVGEGQRVIDTGPYARVRHPMYAGALVLLAGTPLALGSLRGLLTLPPFVAIIVWRLLDEEAVLSRELPGYTEYLRKVRHRLIPGVW